MSSAHDIGFETVECESDAAGGGEAAEITQNPSAQSHRNTGQNFWQYFRNASNKISKPSNAQATAPANKKPRMQRDVHYCLVCNKTISRGNQASKARHAESNHKNDRSYDCAKVIVPIDHQDAVVAMKKNDLCVKDNKTHESEVEVEEMHMEEPLEEVSAEFQPQTPGVPVRRKSTNQCAKLQSPENSGGGYSISSDEDTNDVPVENDPSASKVQSTLNFTREKVDVDSNENFTEVNRKLDILLQKLEITSNENNVEENKDTTTAVTILKEATCLADIDGSGFKFYPGEFDGGLVRCEICFEMICEKHPALLDKNPLEVQRKKIETAAGNSSATGILIQQSRKEQLMVGSNQVWYSFKNMMIEHASCSTTRNGGLMHYKALVAQKEECAACVMQSIKSSTACGQNKGCITAL